MKKRFFTTNIDLAVAAAFGGLTVMPMFPLFFEQHGLRYSVVALAITLWGFLSIRQLDTPQEPQRDEETPPVFHKPQHWKNRRRLITATVLVLVSGVMLFGAIKIIDATQNQPPCTQQTRPTCIKQKQKPTCPQRPCTLNAAAPGTTTQ